MGPKHRLIVKNKSSGCVFVLKVVFFFYPECINIYSVVCVTECFKNMGEKESSADW